MINYFIILLKFLPGHPAHVSLGYKWGLASDASGRIPVFFVVDEIHPNSANIFLSILIVLNNQLVIFLYFFSLYYYNM